MTEQELKKLERNLTKSASKARQGYVRMMVGHTESDQGFGPIEGINIFNYIQNKETTLKEFLEDCGKLHQDHKDLKLSHNDLQDRFSAYVRQQNLNKEVLEQNLQEIEKRVKDLEIFTLD